MQVQKNQQVRILLFPEANHNSFLNSTTAEARAMVYGSNIVTAIFGNSASVLMDGNDSDDEVPDLIEIDKADLIRQLSSLSIMSSPHETIPNEQYGFGQVLKMWEPATRSMIEHAQDHRISATALRYGGQYFPDGLATQLFLSSISRANLIEYEESINELSNNLFDFEQCADHLIKLSSTIELGRCFPASGTAADSSAFKIDCPYCGRSGQHSCDCEHRFGSAIASFSLIFCDSCGRVGHLLANCPRNLTCDSCSRSGHLADYCWNNPPRKAISLKRKAPLVAPAITECEYCGSHNHLSKTCVEGPLRPNPPLTCSICHLPGHSKELCLLLCHKCGNTGHRVSECSTIANCTMCNQIGHWFANCPKNPRCENCGLFGHPAIGCIILEGVRK